MAFLTFNGFIALGTGQSTFVEMIGSGYARQSIAMASQIDNSSVISNTNLIMFSPSAPWVNATQLGLYNLSGQLVMWWNWANPYTFLTTINRTIQIGRISLAVPVPTIVGNISPASSALNGELSGAGVVAGISPLAFFIFMGGQSFAAFDLSSLPTSAAGLPVGAPYNNGNMLCFA